LSGLSDDFQEVILNKFAAVARLLHVKRAFLWQKFQSQVKDQERQLLLRKRNL
jgi:hypothetical protein